MFGHPLVPLGKPPPPSKYPRDRAVWGFRPGEWGVMARHAGSDFHARSMEAEQKKQADRLSVDEKTGREETMWKIRNNWEEACDKRVMMGKLKRKVEFGMQCYEEEIAKKREEVRLRELASEAELERKLVDKAQRLHDEKEAAMIAEIEALKSRREAEKQAFVEEKRLQQYRARCEDVRPIMAKRNLLETKEAQWYQMKEKELLKEREQEIEKMWTAVMLKDIEAKRDREIADVKERYSKDHDNSGQLKLQMAGLEEQKKFQQFIKDEERKESDRISEEIRQEKIRELQDKLKKREASANMLKEQIDKRESIIGQRKKEELEIETTFARLAMAELNRERAEISSNTERLKREVTLYRENLESIKQERLVESRELDRLLDEEQKMAYEKRDENRKKIGEARQKLLDETVCGLHQQLDQKRQRQEAEAKLRAAELEVANQMRLKNEQLDEAVKRENLRQQELYSMELKQQIEYSNLLKKRQQEEIDHQYRVGVMQEEQYGRLVKDLLAQPDHKRVTHPFRNVILGDVCATQGDTLKEEKCPCPPLRK